MSSALTDPTPVFSEAELAANAEAFAERGRDEKAERQRNAVAARRAAEKEAEDAKKAKAEAKRREKEKREKERAERDRRIKLFAKLGLKQDDISFLTGASRPTIRFVCDPEARKRNRKYRTEWERDKRGATAA